MVNRRIPSFLSYRLVANSIILLLLTSYFGVAGDKSSESKVFESKIDAILMQQKEEQHIPGLALAIVKDDHVIYMKAFGLRDIEHHVRATVDTVFPIGSCTKAFTSMAVAISQDEGNLKLEDHPQTFLPYFKMFDPEANSRVTLRDMLSHRTGLMAYADLAAEPAVLTREEYVKAATSAKPTAKFREKFQYSNAMFSAVGEIVAKVNHTTWEAVIHDKIFAPLNMKSSTASIDDLASFSDHAQGYVPYQNAWRPVPPTRSLIALAPAGSVCSSARDMTQWLRILAGGGVLDGKRIVSKAMFREVTKPHIEINGQLSYALGWVTYDWNYNRVIEHNGGSDGISALVSFIPSKHAGFVFLANTSPNHMTKIGNAGKLLWPLILKQEIKTIGPNVTPGSPMPEPESQKENHLSFPAVDDLLQRMIHAVGGEKKLQQHTSLQIRAIKSYENHGVTADVSILAKAPAMHVEEEAWTAAARNIGKLRIYFDGTQGGQETTFGQDAINDKSENDRALLENTFHSILQLKNLYNEIQIVKRTEQAYVLKLTSKDENAITLFVSAKNGLILKRETSDQSIEFADYRSVDGELLPFHSVIHDSLGETTIEVKDAQFNVPIPDSVFKGATAFSRH